MEVLNLGGLIPVSVHKPSVVSDRRTEPRRIISCCANSPFKITKSVNFDAYSNSADALAKGLVGSSLILSSVLGDELAEALTYEEALEQSRISFTSGDSASFDVGGFFDSVLRFGMENPLIIAGGAAVLVVSLVLAQVLQKPKPWGVESAGNAYSKLSKDSETQLLDIRGLEEIREVGSPDIRSLKKRVVTIAFRGEESAFLKKLSLKFKAPENTTLFILDKFDGNSLQVAQLVTANGFKTAFAIRDGAEGTRGWMNSGLPWLQPRRMLNVDFSDFKDSIDSALGDGEVLPVTLGVAAVTGLGVFAFSEVETLLQILGSAALVQFVAKKLLFAEDRKVTFQQIDEFLNTKVAPKELVDELKVIGKALLPVQVEASSSSNIPAIEVQKFEAAAEPKVETAAQPPAAINSVPKSKISDAAIPGFPRSLSPYPYYPDFKPPTSPTPSKP